MKFDFKLGFKGGLKLGLRQKSETTFMRFI